MARPAHEKAADIRRREQALSHWKAEIVRGAVDHRTLEQELRRALDDADVKKDPALGGMIRAFVAERVRELAKLKPQHSAEHAIGMQPGALPNVMHRDNHVAHQEEILGAIDRLAIHFDDYATRFFEAEARSTFERLRELADAHPQWVSPSIMTHCRELLDKLGPRRREFLEHIESLAKRAEKAAMAGDHDHASKILRRLAGVNAAHPQMLPDERFAQIRERMSKAGKVHEHREAIQRLIARERSVAKEIKSLTHAVHHFHHVSRTASHDSDSYRQAEAAYHAALEQVQAHDKEWLAALILELVDILGEWTHPPHKVAAQLDRFVASVRKSLHKLHREIEQLRQETKDSGARA